jgi:hypothetical protein
MTLLLVLEWESASTLLVTAFELVLYPASGFSNLLVHSLAACQAAWFFVLESHRMCCWQIRIFLSYSAAVQLFMM